MRRCIIRSAAATLSGPRAGARVALAMGAPNFIAAHYDDLRCV
jgi:hypothetical protein